MREMRKADLPAVVDIQARITRSEVSTQWRKMLASHVGNPCLPGIVAEQDGEVIAFIIGEIKVGGFGAQLTGWIEMMGVTPEHMGGGIGRALAQKIFDHFHDQGVEQILTSVRWDWGDMLAFFKNLGFDQSPFINLQLGGQ